jgi:hypothetical protein
MGNTDCNPMALGATPFLDKPSSNILQVNRAENGGEIGVLLVKLDGIELDGGIA